MKTKFTNGKWFTKNESKLFSEIFSENGLRIAEVKSFGKDKVFNDPTVSQRIANAKLISAAPDLFNSLNDLLIYCRSNSTSQLEPLIRNAENAIKKATS